MNMKLFPGRRTTRAVVAIVLTVVVALSVRAQVVGALTPADAARLLELQKQIQAMERKHLGSDADFGQAREALAAAEAALAEHRAAFERSREEDSAYRDARSALEALKAEKDDADAELDRIRNQARAAQGTITASQSTISRARPRLNVLDKQIAKHERVMSVLTQPIDDDDVGVNQSGNRDASTAKTQEILNELQAERNALMARATEANDALSAAKEDLSGLNKAMVEAGARSRELAGRYAAAQQAMLRLEREWDNRYFADPATTRLQSAVDEAGNRRDAARATALASLASVSKTYVVLVHEREAIEKSRVEP